MRVIPLCVLQNTLTWLKHESSTKRQFSTLAEEKFSFHACRFRQTRVRQTYSTCLEKLNCRCHSCFMLHAQTTHCTHIFTSQRTNRHIAMVDSAVFNSCFWCPTLTRFSRLIDISYVHVEIEFSSWN